jgi:hypothetical protein
VWVGYSFSIDLFASASNFKVDKFYAYTHSDGCAGVNAFVHSWNGERAYCAPLVALIMKVIRKIEASVMSGVVLVPLWRGAKFWLSAFPDWRHLSSRFSRMLKLEAKTRAWGVSPKDAFAGPIVTFLALEIAEGVFTGPGESLVDKKRCFGRLFNKECVC